VRHQVVCDMGSEEGAGSQEWMGAMWCREVGVGGSGWEWVGVGGSGWEWVGVGGSG
jgi:hypothetical protein